MEEVKFIRIGRESKPLYESPMGSESWHTYLNKAETPDPQSNQKSDNGRRYHPFNMHGVKKFRRFNEHHSTCILTKASAICGLGFKTPSEQKQRRVDPADTTDIKQMESLEESKVAEVLDPLCRVTFQDVLNAACQDYVEVANGYIEVVRPNEQIEGLFMLRGEEVYVVVEPDGHIHYDIVPADGSVQRKFAAFGDKQGLASRLKLDPKNVSEVIHFPMASSISTWYGFPDWLACAATIELVQMITQKEFDFFQNRGVPEFFAFFLGAQLDNKSWEEIRTAIKANIGLGNAHKSTALNIASPDMKVQIEKMAVEAGGEQGSVGLFDNAALRIVTAHRVPPLLAGIQIPGKLGATNELPNALMSFQKLCIGPAQRSIMAVLRKTLGTELGLTKDDFVFKTIVDEINVAQMDTVARMRQTVPEAQAEGRDLEAGVKKAFESMTAEQRVDAVSNAFVEVFKKMVAA